MLKRFAHLRLLIPVVALALLAVAIGVASYATREAEHDRTRDAVQERVRERLNQLQISSQLFLQLGLKDRLHQLVASIAAEPDLLRILIVGADGRVIAANRYAQVNEYWHKAAPDLDGAQVASAQSSQSVRIALDPLDGFVEGFAGLCANPHSSALRPTDCGFITYRVDLQFHYKLTDQALRLQTGYFVAGVLGMFLVLLLVLHLVVTRRATGIVAALRAFNSGERTVRVPRSMQDELGAIGTTVNQVLDEIDEHERALVDQRERLRALFDTVVDAIITIDGEGTIQTVNPATEQLFGYERGELLGQNVSVLTPMPIRAEHDQYIRNYLETGERKIIGAGREVQAVTKDGNTFAAELTVSEMSIGGVRMFTGVVRDISERVKLRETMEKVNAELVSTNQALWQSAKTDGLTGLANRRHFDDTLETEIRRTARQGSPLSLLLLDLDYFKSYNDHYGHYDGDKCLKAVAQVLSENCKRSGELPARYGGEEFAVILPYNDHERALGLAERIRAGVEALMLPHSKSRISNWVTCSVGVATYVPKDNKPVRDRVLITSADNALYKAKAAGRNRVCSSDLDEIKGGDSAEDASHGGE